MAARGAPETGARSQGRPRRRSLRGSAGTTGWPGPGLTEWATPHRNTPTSGSAARNTFTFCCTKCFFLVLEAKPKPWPGAAVLAGTVAGGAEEDAIASCVPDPGEARAGRDPAPDPGSGAHLSRRHVTGGRLAGGWAGRTGPRPLAPRGPSRCGGWDHLAAGGPLEGYRGRGGVAWAGLFTLRSGASLLQRRRRLVLPSF